MNLFLAGQASIVPYSADIVKVSRASNHVCRTQLKQMGSFSARDVAPNTECGNQ